MVNVSDEAKVDIPHLPRHDRALAPIPSRVLEQWEATYERAYRRALADKTQFPHQAALSEANALLKVEEPQDHEGAHTIPDWQVLHREELDYCNLPHHARGTVESGARKYVRVYTTDGKEYFFPIREKETK